MSFPAVLNLDRVHVWRGDRHVLQGVSLELRAGELLLVSGPNGTGKSTLLRVMCGLLRPEQGRVDWSGLPINDDRESYQAQLAYASHEPALKADLTALENLKFSVGLKLRSSTAELVRLLERTGVAAIAHLPVRVLSAGQRRRVAMARILGLRASLWLLDEPYTNLDTAGGELVTRLLQEHVDNGGLGVVVAHHDLDLHRGLRRMALSA
jgi:heme exporter protein A